MAAQELEEVIANRESASTTETVLLCDAYADAVAQVIENPSTADGLSNGKSIPRRWTFHRKVHPPPMDFLLGSHQGNAVSDVQPKSRSSYFFRITLRKRIVKDLNEIEEFIF